MCGIIGYVGKEKALEVIKNGLQNLEYRGYDSSGIAYIQNNQLYIKKEVGKVASLIKELPTEKNVDIAIGHNRWATHGGITKENAHPHTCDKITIVHNGIIENYLEIKEYLQKQGVCFVSETDTEVAAALLNYLYTKKQDLKQAIMQFEKIAKGSFAIGLLHKDNPHTLYAIKKNSPLIIGLSSHGNFIASDVPAILTYSKKYITLEDKEFAILTQNKVTVYDAEGKIVGKEIKEFNGDKFTMDKMGYEHYMQKEIMEEPMVIKKVAKSFLENPTLPDLKKYNHICIVACGSASHAGWVGKQLIEEYAKIPVDVEIASEFRYKNLFPKKDTLVIAISQSGETADTLEAIKKVKEKGIDTLGIINVKESSIARVVDHALYTNAGSEIAVATTKAYAAQIEILTLFAYMVAKNCDNTKSLTEIKNFVKDLEKLPTIMQKTLNKIEEYQQIAEKIYNQEHLFFIGRGIDYALCMEGSLKLKEISYLHSEAYAAGELKHGTISLIEEGTPVIGLVTNPKIFEKTISNLKEVKARGANVIYITTKSLFKNGDFFNQALLLPEVNPLLQPLINIIPLQLIAYYVAKYRKCDIDKPKNLAKSVTVE